MMSKDDAELNHGRIETSPSPKWNLVILGTARSGSSLTAGCLAESGYFMGNKLLSEREANPKGFFEDHDINRINDWIILTTRLGMLKHYKKAASACARLYGINHQWLTRLSEYQSCTLPRWLHSEVEEYKKQQPFCYKDPRFSYALPAWNFDPDTTKFICVFRHPLETAASIVKEATYQKETRCMKITLGKALEVYRCMYERILQMSNTFGQWQFLHYRQMLNGDGVDLLEKFVGHSIDHSFIEPSLYRHQSDDKTPPALRGIYQQLCQRATYHDS